MDEVVEQWARFEVSLDGPSAGNSFVDVKLSAEFSNGLERMRVDGFYDGGGVYRIRFMPTKLGPWSYVTESTVDELSGCSGSFTCVQPRADRHGPVRVRDTFHFAYADGTPVIDDECEYESNIKRNWGNITARELVHRFWISVCYGGYAGHGETYEHPEDVLWWSKGGVLHGLSASRIAFLRRIVEQGPRGVEPLLGDFPWDRTPAGGCGDYRLIYPF